MFDSEEMLYLGIAFMNAGNANFREGAIEHRSAYQNVAGVVNLAFACELFIKCLLNINGVEEGGHKLDDLWAKFKNMCIDEASDIEMFVMNNLETEETFDEMLHNDSNVFYNYRYLYDPKRLTEIRDNHLRVQFLRVFAFILQQSLREKLGVDICGGKQS